MISRCASPSNASWERYGGRGITVCAEWRSSFVTFRDWATANGYDPELQLDRRDNDKGYSPDNCRWVTSVQNMNNTSKNRRITAFGRTLTLSEWAREPECSVSTVTLTKRLGRGWDPELAITKPARVYGVYE
jgi:hypothetical protein